MKLICGIDEAGRGPLSGPVFAAAVILNSTSVIDGLMDSKKLSANRRSFLYEEIKNKSIDFAFAFASVDEIDQMNILNASLLAMKRSFDLLKIKPNIIYVDGLYCPPIKDVKIESIIKGDSKVQAISAASIVAKVERDLYMLELDKIYPEYNLKKHKGYPTKEHIALIKKHGVKKIHRKTFRPITQLINKKDT